MKKNKIRYITEAAALVLIVVVFVIANNRIDKSKAEQCVVRENTGYDICVEKAGINGNKMEMSGWCLRGGLDTMQLRESTKMQVVLMNMDDNSEKYFISTDIVIREDMNERYNDGFDHSYSGFEAEVRTSKVDFEEKNWEILLYYITWGGEEADGLFGIRSGYSIVNGELVTP